MKTAAFPTTLSIFVAMTLGGCTLESIEIKPCVSEGTIGFLVEDIEGWLSDYDPRPVSVWVGKKGDNNLEYSGVWSTSLPYRSDRETGYEARPAHNLILYGQELPNWTTTQPPEVLVKGERYEVQISDGGHDGWASFVAGSPLPACQ